MKSLMELYCELSMEEGIQLPAFVRRIQAQEFGARPRAEVETFLRELEEEMLLNIESRIEGAPHLDGERELRIARVHARIQQLIETLGAASAPE